MLFSCSDSCSPARSGYHYYNSFKQRAYTMSSAFFVFQSLPYHRGNSKRNNIYFEVLRRSLTGSSLRRDLKILRSLIVKKDSKFYEVWWKKTKHPVGFDSQHLFFDKFRSCYTSYGFDGKPELLYKLSPIDESTAGKIESALVFESTVDQVSFTKCNESRGYCPSLLAVTADGWLIRYDLNSGKILEKVYLSKHYRFKYIIWECDLQRLVIKSVHSTNHNAPLVFLSIFAVAPLEFLALLPIEKEIFGQNTIDATASTGFLVVMQQSNKIRFYNLWEIIRMYSIATKLGNTFKVLNAYSGGHHQGPGLLSCAQYVVVGEPPNGLPVNVVFTSKPVVLFEINSYQHIVSFGGHPWHYISCPQSQNSLFHVCSVKDSNLAKDGILEMDYLSVEPDQAYFHADNSGRILHIGAHTIRCLKLCQARDDAESSTETEFELRSCFSLDLKNTQRELSERDYINNHVRFTSSGRMIKVRQDQTLRNPGFETVLDVDYEDELDLLVVLLSYGLEREAYGVIALYDNQVGSLLHETTIKHWKQDADHSVMMEKDTIVHIMKDDRRTYSCTVYRLFP